MTNFYKRTLLFSSLFFACSVLCQAAAFSQTHFKLTTYGSKTFERLYCGIANNATYGVDTALGEDDLPPAAPSGLYAYFYFVDTTLGERVMSYKNFQPIPTKNQEYREFRFEVSDIALWLDLEWNNLGDEIDSARLMDGYDSFDLFDIDMKKQTSYHLDNPSCTRFLVRIWYHVVQDTTAVNEVDNNESLEIFPNPTEDFIKIKGKSNIVRFKIYDFLGNIVKTNDGNDAHYSNSGEIETNGLMRGLYFVELYDDLGNKYIKKFIKK